MNNTEKARLIAGSVLVLVTTIAIFKPKSPPPPPPTEAEIIENTAWYAGKVVVPHSPE